MGFLTALLVSLVEASKPRLVLIKVIQATAYLEDLVFLEEHLLNAFMLATCLLPLRILKSRRRDMRCSDQCATYSY